MSVNIGAMNAAKIRLAEQGSNPSSPAATFQYLFCKSDGVYVKDSSGAVTGPFGAGSDPLEFRWNNSVIASPAVVNFIDDVIVWDVQDDPFASPPQTKIKGVTVLDTFRTPASASDTGTTGETCWDDTYEYRCVATDTWERWTRSTW